MFKKPVSIILAFLMLPMLPLSLSGIFGGLRADADNAAMEVYISLTGDDDNEGSFQSPFKSFDRVLACVKENKDAGKNIIVYIRGGEYRLSDPIDFTPEIWDNDEYTLTFTPYEDENVTLSGTALLESPEWQTYTAKPGVYMANIGTGYNFDALIVNGQRQILARYPNYIWGEKLKSTISVNDAQLADRVASWQNPAGGFIRALHTSAWGGNDYIITGKSGNQLQYTWVGNNNRGGAMNSTHRIFENIFEELDAPGEWYYDKTGGILYFWPASGTDINSAEFEIAVSEQLVTFKGAKTLKPEKTTADEFAYDYTCVKNIRFDGIKFANTHRTLFTGTFERPLRGDWGIVRNGAVYMENSENIQIVNSEFTGIGGNAVMINAYNKDGVIDYCDFTDIGASCVLVAGLVDSVRNPSSWDYADGTPANGSDGNHKTTMGDFTAGPRDNNYPRNMTVSNCYMYNSGVFEKQSAGVCISIASKINVLRNTMHYMPRAAINVSDGTFGGHEIAYNDLFDTVRETGDHGPFNSWGRDRFWSLNGFDTGGSRGEIKAPYALYDVIDPVLLHNNRIHETGGSFGIDLDDGSSNYKVYNNLLLGASIKLREGFQREVYNNIIVGSFFEQHVTYAQNGDIYRDNIVANTKGVNVIGGSAQQTTVFERNFYYNGIYTVDSAPGNVNLSRLDPIFVNPNANNYSVAENSPVLYPDITRFVNFPVSNDDFGRIDKPNAPVYRYSATLPNPSAQTGKFIDYGPDDATSTRISPVDEGLRSAAGLPDLNGVYLLNVASGGYFAEQGLRTGDVIRSLNGKNINEVKDLYDVFTENYEKRNFDAVIYRNQQPMNIQFSMVEEPIYPWMVGGVKSGSGWQIPGGRDDHNTYSGKLNVSATNKSGDYFEYTFYGTGIGFISEMYTDQGKYDVYIDGEFVEQISGYNTERLRQLEVYSKKDLEPGKHVLTIYNRENKWLILDAFKVYNTYIPDVPAYRKGDVNNDDEINIFDIMAIRDHVFGKAALVDEAFDAADVNGDEDVNIFDIMAIRDHIFGKELLD